MKKDNLVYIEDVQNAVVKIEGYVESISYEQFLEDDMRQDAVIRQLMIIGEAVNKVDRDFFVSYPEFPLKKVVAMRNFLIHNYDDVDLEIVWNTSKEDLLQLKDSVDQILG